MVTQYIEVLQSYSNPNTLKCFNILKCFNLMKVTIGLQHFNILGYHRIAILRYIANYLFLQRTLIVNLRAKMEVLVSAARVKNR